MSATRADGWTEWGQHVLFELQRLDAALQACRQDCHVCREKRSDEMRRVSVDVGKLEVKASAWGAVGGILAAGAMLLARMI